MLSTYDSFIMISRIENFNAVLLPFIEFDSGGSGDDMCIFVCVVRQDRLGDSKHET